MNKIPRIKLVRATRTASDSKPTLSRPARIVKNSAIKESQPSLQSETYQGPLRKHNTKAMKIVNHFAKTAAADVKQGVPLFYHPDFEPSSLILPKDRMEINSWCNYFYKYDALVATAVDMHAELPLSKIRLDLPKMINKKQANRILEHYVDMIGNTGIDLFNKLLMIGVEYYKLGNVFPWAQMNGDGTRWARLTCLNPDYTHIEKLSLTNAIKVYLVPDDRLRHIVHAGPDDKKTGELFQTLSDEVVEYVTSGKEIPLSTDPNEGSHVAHLARKIADYADWGTSIIERNFKTLVYKDRLRQSQDAIATRHLTPKHLIHAEYASRADVNEIREQVEDAMMNPDSAIITNYELHWELVGTSSGLMQLATEREWVTEDLLVGLMINKNVLLGEGNFAAGQTVLEILNQRYAIFREQLESYIEKSLFLPIARNCGYVEYEPGTVKKEKREIYLYPKVRWNRLNLTDDTQHKQMLGQAVTEGKVDIGTWLEYFGLNSDSIAERLKQNEDTVMDPVYNELRRSIMMEVGRSLGPAVAKVYAEAYGLELEDQGGGGMGMFASSKLPITKFGKDFDIEYTNDGGLSIKPKMIIEEHDIPKVAETREERQHDRDVNKSNSDIETAKDNLEVTNIDSEQLKPPREDLKRKKMPNILKATQILNRRFGTIEKEEAEEQSVDIPITSVSELGYTYDENTPLQSQEKLALMKEKNSAVNDGQGQMSQLLSKQGVDEYTRKLVKTAENDIAGNYYKLINKTKDNGLQQLATKVVNRIYAGMYHSLVNPKESIFKSSQAIKEVFSDDVNKRASKLVQKIEIISSANRKIAQNTSSDNVAGKSREVFAQNEHGVRKAFREIVNEIFEDIKGTMT
jgi:hypothetical protein